VMFVTNRDAVVPASYVIWLSKISNRCHTPVAPAAARVCELLARILLAAPTLMAYRVVVVDDDIDTLDYAELLLNEEGYEVVRCTDHADAYACIREAAPDLVVLDLIGGHGLAGWETFVQLGIEPQLAVIPVILYSASPHIIGTKVEAVQARGGEILLKPFASVALLEKAEQSLARSTPADG
jgi:DNA-binding response OmpR family regulator